MINRINGGVPWPNKKEGLLKLVRKREEKNLQENEGKKKEEKKGDNNLS